MSSASLQLLIWGSGAKAFETAVIEDDIGTKKAIKSAFQQNITWSGKLVSFEHSINFTRVQDVSIHRSASALIQNWSSATC